MLLALEEAGGFSVGIRLRDAYLLEHIEPLLV